MTPESIRIEREAREKRARKRAEQLEPGDYYADGNFVMVRGQSVLGTRAVECESHWDACLVMLYTGTPDAYGRTGEQMGCDCCGGTGLEYDETCVTCGGFGWVRA